MEKEAIREIRLSILETWRSYDKNIRPPAGSRHRFTASGATSLRATWKWSRPFDQAG